MDLTPEGTVSLAIIFSVIAVVAQVSGIWANHRKGERDEEDRRMELERNFVRLNLKIDQLAESIEKLVESDRRREAELSTLRVTSAQYQEQLKTLFDRAADHEGRIKKLESR